MENKEKVTDYKKMIKDFFNEPYETAEEIDKSNCWDIALLIMLAFYGIPSAKEIEQEKELAYIQGKLSILEKLTTK